MIRSMNSVTRFWLCCVACVIAIGGLGCCNGDNGGNGGGGGGGGIEVADHWLVIHNKVGIEGDPWNACKSVPVDDNIAYLPSCLDVEMGDTVGFANYSDTAVTINHFQVLDAPTNPFSLPSGDKVIFKVKVQGQRQLFDIQSSSPFDHGGPEMIVRP